MFGCCNSFKSDISLIAVLGIPSSSEASLIFFKANNSLFVLSYDFHEYLKNISSL